MNRLRSTWHFVAVMAVLALLLLATRRVRHHGIAQRVSLAMIRHLSPNMRAKVLSPFWKGRLFTPTQITKLGSLYFIVDCFHNRVIYSSSLTKPIVKWHLLDGDLAGPHSIATDSVLYVVDDTGRGSLRVYRMNQNAFEHVQTFSNLGQRTHRVRYDPATNAFYSLSANSQQMTKLVRNGNRLELVYEKPLPFLNGTGTRSFTFDDGDMLFVSGPNHESITRVRYKDDSYTPLAFYAVPAAVAGRNGMNDIFKSGKYYYITSSQKVIVRTTSMEALQNGQWENIYGRLGFQGTPYDLDEFDGRIYISQINEYSGLLSFVADGDAMKDVRTQFNSGPGTWEDIEVQVGLPK